LRRDLPAQQALPEPAVDPQRRHRRDVRRRLHGGPRVVRDQAHHRDRGVTPMLVFALIVGLLLLAIAIAMIARAVAVPAGRPEVIDQIGSYGFAGTAPTVEDAGDRGSLFGDVALSAGNLAAKWFGQMRENEIRRRLVSAGWYSTTPRAFLGYQLMGG